MVAVLAVPIRPTETRMPVVMTKMLIMLVEVANANVDMTKAWRVPKMWSLI
jgi:hypothetical protein